MIQVKNLSVPIGGFELSDLSFNIPSGCYAVLMGRSGSGKTSLLETLAGLLIPSAGEIWLGDLDVTLWRPAERGVGYVPQDGALFPSMTVAEHLGFALRVRRRPRAEIEQRVTELLALLDLDALAQRKPQGLSGGERQRVALGRALSAAPAVLLLDEPLSALDMESREEMHTVLQRVHSGSTTTILHVTHDREDALRQAELLLRMEDGQIRVQDLDSLACESRSS